MPADALGLGLSFVLVLGLLVAACLALTTVLAVIVSLQHSVASTLSAVVMAGIAGFGAFLVSTEAIYVIVCGVVGLVLGVVVGVALWSAASPPKFTTRQPYRLAVLGVAVACIASGLGVWVVLVGTAGPRLMASLFADHPTEFLTLVVVTGVPIVCGVTTVGTAVRESKRRHPVG